MKAGYMKAKPRGLGHGTVTKTEGWALDKDDMLTVFGVTMWDLNLVYSHGTLVAIMDGQTGWVRNDFEYYYRTICRMVDKYSMSVQFLDHKELQEKFTALMVQQAAKAMDYMLTGGVVEEPYP